ncbi:MAG: sigma-70 family RNA polymerase sigma factor [Firmicutes bacterium]|nr:sigma-70 family RNA polymerase sigma factor [[Eubacterium] siraeum]MCM1487254.1 sigma-70 family RNA polymerase sigma factor [Bacillota bacterium]
MNKNDIAECADFLLNAALHKCNNIADAQDLAQDTLLAALSAADKAIDNPRAWLTAVLNRKYYDLLRRKYNKPTVSFDVTENISDSGAIYDGIERAAEAEEIRRCLACLTKLYREVTVRYYMHGEKVKDIALSLGISENTVKSRLDEGRKRIGKEFDMENYTKQSYEPEILMMSCSGQCGLDGEPFCLVGNDKIAMNLLILAYKKPVTVTELARAIGIAAAYIEPVVDKLAEGGLMKRTGDKVYTDFILYNPEDRTNNAALEKQTADGIYKDVWVIMEKALEELSGCDFYKRQSKSKRAKLDSFFAVRTLNHAVNGIRDDFCGKTPYEEYPERPGGGKWIAMGSRYPANYDFGNAGFEHGKYYISGESCMRVTADDGEKNVELTICEYNTLLGEAQLGMRDILKRRMTDGEICQMLYAVYIGKEEQLPLINAGCFENFDKFVELRYLARESGKAACDVPVITEKERLELYDLSEKYDNILAEKFRSDFIRLMVDPVRLPPHLKSVPEFQRYMYCCSTVSMRIVENALKDGLFSKCADYPAPAVLISVKEE